MPLNLSTTSKITWCPGCPNSQILVAYRQAIESLVNSGSLKIENLVACAGIGCHGKISNYLNVNSFTALHGRVIPAMTGIKCANPNLTVIGMSGDGDSYSEGLEHLIHAARRNSDIKIFIHDNQVFALTTGQTSAMSPKGFKSKTTPYGSIDEPFEPFSVLLSAGASFVARTYAGDIAGTKKIVEEAIKHKGFSFVEIIQPCITFFDTRDYFKERVFLREGGPADNIDTAIKLSRKEGERVPLGIFYNVERPTFEEQLLGNF
ncbi:MAG: thiamine pyrophosphate-dependent enzyme [Candidatus Paceibacterota bacterium]